MAGTQLTWSDEQVGQRPQATPGGNFAWSDEKDEENADSKNAGENSGPAEIRAYHGDVKESPGLAFSRGYAPAGQDRKFSGGFFDRAGSQFSEDLNDPKKFIPSWHALLGAPGMAYDGLKQAYDTWEHRNDTNQPDPAEQFGHLGVPALTSLVTHSADAFEPFPEQPPVYTDAGIKARAAARVPAWKTMDAEGTAVPSIVNRQPYAAPARSRAPIATSEAAAPPVAPPAAEAAPAATNQPMRNMPDPTNMSTAEREQAVQQSVSADERAAFLNRMKAAAEPAPQATPEAEPAAPPVKNFTPGRITPTGERYLDQMREFLKNLPKEAAAEESETTAVNTNNRRPMRIRNVVAAPDEDLTSALEDSLQFAQRNAARRRIQ